MGKFIVKGEKEPSLKVRKIETPTSVSSKRLIEEVEKMIAEMTIPEKVIEKTETVVKEVSKVDSRSRKYARMLREKIELLDLRLMQDHKHDSVVRREHLQMISELKEENRKLRLEVKAQLDEIANRPVPVPQITEVHSTPKSVYYAVGVCILMTVIALFK